MPTKVMVPFDQARTFTALPEGKYQFRVVDASLGETSKGETAVKIQYMVVAPEKVNGTRVRGQKITRTYGFNENGLEDLRQAVQALYNKEIPRKALSLDLEKLKGKECIAEVRKNGDYINLRNYRPVGETEVEGDEEPEEGDDLGFDDEDEE